MPEEQSITFGPKAEEFFAKIQAMGGKQVEVKVESDDPEVEQLAYDTEYGASGEPEQPYMRPAMYRLRQEMDDIVRDEGIEGVAERAQELVDEAIDQAVVDEKVREEIKSAVQVHVIE